MTFPPRGAAPRDDLTPREDEVMALLAQGYAQKEIARKLGISFHTVHDHLQMAFTKFRVDNAKRAITVWHERKRGLR